MTFRRLLLAATFVAAPALMPPQGPLAGLAGIPSAQAQGTIRIGMTAADIPLTHGQPDQGFEGNRFTGIPLYDALTTWDLSAADKPSTVIPGLATEWAVDEADKTRLGIDGIMGGYLLITGQKGLELLEESKIKNPEAPVSDVHALMSAFRFLWQYEPTLIPKDRLKAAVRMLLDRPEVADLAIADLARWKDWTIHDRLMEVYKKGDPGNPLGEISVRQDALGRS